jgi:hypothetical protein
VVVEFTIELRALVSLMTLHVEDEIESKTGDGFEISWVFAVLIDKTE